MRRGASCWRVSTSARRRSPASYSNSMIVIASRISGLPSPWKGLASSTPQRRRSRRWGLTLAVTRCSVRLLGTCSRSRDAPRKRSPSSKKERLWEQKYFEPFALALVCVALGKTEAALDWLERSEDVRSSWLTVHAALDSRLDPLRGHARFHALMARMGLKG